MISIKVRCETYPGFSVRETARNMREIAKKLDCWVLCDHNGVDLHVCATSNLDKAQKDYHYMQDIRIKMEEDRKSNV